MKGSRTYPQQEMTSACLISAHIPNQRDKLVVWADDKMAPQVKSPPNQNQYRRQYSINLYLYTKQHRGMERGRQGERRANYLQM